MVNRLEQMAIEDIRNEYPDMFWKLYLAWAEQSRGSSSVEDRLRELLITQNKGKRSHAAAQKALKKRGGDELSKYFLEEKFVPLINTDEIEESIGITDDDMAEWQTNMLEMATILSNEFDVHKELKKSGETHIVRRNKALPRSTIAYLAGQQLNFYTSFDASPPRILTRLINDLLETDDYGQNEARNITQERRAVIALVIEPKLSVSGLAHVVGVDKATASRWRKDPFFQERVEKLRARNVNEADMGHILRMVAMGSEILEF